MMGRNHAYGNHEPWDHEILQLGGGGNHGNHGNHEILGIEKTWVGIMGIMGTMKTLGPAVFPSTIHHCFFRITHH